MTLGDSHFYRFQAFAVLAIATILFVIFFDVYQEIGPELLPNADFSQGLAKWNFSNQEGAVSLEQPGTVRIINADSGKGVSLQQTIIDPGRFRFLRLTGDIKTDKVKRGKKSWQKARLVLSSHDQDGRWLPAPHHVASLAGTRPWRQYSQVFEIIPAAEQLRVSAQLPRATGILWVKNLSLREVYKKTTTVYFMTGGIILWGLFLAWLVIPYIAAGRTFFLRALVFLSVFAVLMGTLSPGVSKLQFQKDSVQVIQNFIEQPEEIASIQSSERDKNKAEQDRRLFNLLQAATKSGHFILFALLGLSLPIALPLADRRFLLIDLLMLAAATELMQFFIQGRTPLVKDFLIDVAGIIVGLAIVWLWRKSHRRKGALAI